MAVINNTGTDGRRLGPVTVQNPFPIEVIPAVDALPVVARPPTYDTLAVQSLTVDATSGGVRIDQAKITSAVVRAFITLETAQIRWQLHSSTAITAGGTEGSDLMEVGDNLTLIGRNEILNARFIRTGGTSGIAQVTLQREV